MNLYETFDTPELVDSAKEFPLSESAYITLLPLTGEKSKRYFQKLMEPYAARLKAKSELSEKEVRQLNLRHFCECVIVGWRGLKGKDGEEIPFSRDAAKTLLGDPKLAKFFDLIATMASNDAAFAEEQAIEDEGNSSNS